MLSDYAKPGIVRGLLAAALGIYGVLSLHSESKTATFYGFSLSCLIVSILIITWNKKRGIFAPTHIFLFVFWLFHCGLLVSIEQIDDMELLRAVDWIFVTDIQPAALAVGYGILAYFLGVISMRMTKFKYKAAASKNQAFSPRVFGVTGIAVGAISTIMIIGTLFANGASLGGGYLSYLETSQDTSFFGYLQLFAVIGVGLAIASRGNSAIVGWVIFGFLALFYVAMGARGSAMFPALALFAIEARYRKFRLWAFLIAAIGILSLISLSRQSRHYGVTELLSGTYAVTPWQGLAEMGASLYPVVVVQEWMAGGLVPAAGGTIVAIPLGIVDSMFSTNLASKHGGTLFNVEIAEKVGQIGGSPIAEGFRNGNLLGVVLTMVSIGLLLCAIEMTPLTVSANAYTIVILAPLLSGVRNALGPLLIHIIIGLTVVFILSMVGRSHKAISYKKRNS